MMKKLFSFVLLAVLLVTAPARATWTTFDAVDDLLTVTQFAGININTFTFMCHANLTGVGENAGGRIADKSNSATLDTEGWNYNAFSGTLLNFSAYNNGSGGGGAGIWHSPSITFPGHVAVSYNGSSTANDPNFYDDAVLLSEIEDATPTAVMTTGAHNLGIGNRPAGDRTWAGQLGDCAMSNVMLTAGQILSASVYGPQWLPGIICYWPMGAYGGRSTGGSGGNSCHATVTGSPVTSTTGPRRSSIQTGFIFLGQ